MNEQKQTICIQHEVKMVWIQVSKTCFILFIVSDKPKEEKKDTFAEKMATQVIKNLQVNISSIHLRYEDDVSTDPGSNPDTR